MKFTTIATALATVMVVAAKSCNQGGVYCGSSLLRKGEPKISPSTYNEPKRFESNPRVSRVAGNYRDHIFRTLGEAGVPTDEAHIQDSKFDCLGGGEIVYREFCANGCGGTDNTDPDYCL